MNTAQNKLLKTILAGSCYATLLVGNAHATVTNVGYWRGGENDAPAPDFNTPGGGLGYANSTTLDATANAHTLNAVSNGTDVGPYYTNVGLIGTSTSSYSFDLGGANGFQASVFNTATSDWGIQCYTTSTDGTLISNGDGTGGGYAIFVYNGKYCGIHNGRAVLEGTVPATGQLRNVALVNDNGVVKLFIDGLLDVSAPLGGSAAPSGHFTIGCAYNGNIPAYNSCANGRIDEARLFTFATGAFQASDLLRGAQNYVVPQPTTNVAYWRGGENDFPQAPQGSRFTVDVAGSNNLQPWNLPQSTLGYNEYGPYYSYTGLVGYSSNSYAFDPGAGNLFSTSVFSTTRSNWGIQCYTTSTEGTVISNGDGNGGGYAIFVYNGKYCGLLNGISLLEGTVAATGAVRNVALVNNDGSLQLYVDGVLDVSSRPGAANTPSGHFTIGGAFNGNIGTYNDFANASIDEARLFTFQPGGGFQPSDLLDYVPAATYASWATANAGGQAANLDWDNDGVPNGVEFFMNAAPGFTANPGLVGNTVTWSNGGNISASTYGTQFVVQTSSDLVTWEDVAEGDLNTNTSGPAGSLSYSVDPANGPAKQFVRLKVTP